MKRSHKHSIDELFADNLNDFSADPPEILWKKISAQITVAAPQVTKTYRLYKYSAAASVVILLSIFSYAWLGSFDKAPNQQLTKASTLVLKSPSQIFASPLFKDSLEEDDLILEPIISPIAALPPLDSFKATSCPIESSGNNNQLIIESENSISRCFANLGFVSAKSSFLWPKAESKILPDLAELKTDDYLSYPYLYLSASSGFERLQSDNENILKSNKSNAFLSLLGGIQFQNFFVETGIQVNRIQGQFEGSRNSDFIYHNGETSIVDSIGYSVIYDSLNQPYYFPIYYLSSVPNFDTSVVQVPAMISKSMIYAEIPVNLGVSQTVRRHHISASMGMSYSFKLSESIDNSSNGERLLSPEIPNFWSLRISLGYQYAITNHWNAGVKFNYRYFSKTGSNSNQFFNSAYSLGFNPCITYNF